MEVARGSKARGRPDCAPGAPDSGRRQRRAAALTSPLVLAASIVAFTAAFSAFRWLEATGERDFSATGVVAAMLTFALGAYSVLGEMRVAVAAAVVATLLLALKQPLHRGSAVSRGRRSERP